MGKQNYSEKFKNPLWQKKRLEIMQRDNFKCVICCDNQTELNVHHLRYSNGEIWEIESNKLVTLCKSCHKMVHDTLDLSDNHWLNRQAKLLNQSNSEFIVFFLMLSVAVENNSNLLNQLIIKKNEWLDKTT